jgi:hypothetical protein
MKTVKLCKDCKLMGGLTGQGVCIRPIPIKHIDYVYGKSTEALCRFCNEERIDNSGCGPDAIYFESKDAPHTRQELMDIARNPDPRD